MSIRYVELRIEAEKFGKEQVRRAKLSLAATRKRYSIRSTWTGKGKEWQSTGHYKKMYRGKINNTGALSNSLEYEVTLDSTGSLRISFSMEDYGVFVDNGRMAKKYAPPPPLRTWANEKGIRFRDFGTGRFIKKSSGLFMVNRKIKYFGIEPTNFFSKPLENLLEDLPEELRDAFMRDVEFNFYESKK